MNDFNRTYAGAGGVPGTMDMSVDAGLRSFMLGVYNKMALGLLLSAVLAYVVGTVAPVTNVVLTAPVVYLVQWGPLAILFGSMFFMRNPSPAGSAALYWTIVTLIGASLGVWVYAATQAAGIQTVGGRNIQPTMTAIAQAFFITAAAFGGLSLWGYTTKRDITGWGGMIMMGIIGIVVLAIGQFVLSAFFGIQSSMFEIILMVAALGLYSALIAWQTQAMKVSYYQMQGDARSLAAMTNMAALNLYIAFVQIFQIILSLLSGRE